MKQVITLSDNAANRIKEIMSKAEKDLVGLRVGVKSGGCAGMSYIMEYTKEVKPNDEVIEDKGVKFIMKQAITLTDNAASRIKDIMSKDENKSLGVRVGVKSGGCAGMSYIMEYAKEINPNDEVIEDKGVKVFIDPGAIMYLLGTEMDYKKEQFSSSFIFKNPNETERCGCGESFKV